MILIPAEAEDKEKWNSFVATEYPPIGAFMLSWEWGDFQKTLNRNVERYKIKEGSKTIALFTLIHEKLPFDFYYGYTPRGPVFDKNINTEKSLEIMSFIAKKLKEKHSKFLFIRFEPPINEKDLPQHNSYLVFTRNNIQPRKNHAVPLKGSLPNIKANLHGSTRSNIKRAVNRGVKVIVKNSFSEDDYRTLFAMIEDTKRRNSGVNTYPREHYFRTFINTIPQLTEKKSEGLSLRLYWGYQNEEPAGVHMVVYFGTTATYLFGTTFTKNLNSKIATYLHWQALSEANEKGMLYYDLGGIDEKIWPTITDFKRQFRGKEWEYVGIIDAPLRPFFYYIFIILRAIKRKIKFNWFR